MKKYLLVSLFVIGTTVASAADSLLYWMAAAPSEREWDYANLMYTSEGYGKGTVIDAVDFLGNGQSAKSWADLSSINPSDYSFYVEYMSEGGDSALFSSAILSYADIVNSIKTSRMTMEVPVATFNVPEPTSGMMLLLGMGLLALKRKKA